MRARGVRGVISDLYDDEPGVAAELKRAARIGHDVIVFHVLARDEMALEIHGATSYEDMETGKVVVAGDDVAARYGAEMREFLGRWRERSVAHGIDYSLISTDVPLDKALRSYLLRRARVTRS